MSQNKLFHVADLDASGDLKLKAEYSYDLLERLPGCLSLITHFSTLLWRDPEEFDTPLPESTGLLTLRWRASSADAGIATIRAGEELASLSLLASGIDPKADALTLGAFQRHLISKLHDTGHEPAFALLDLAERPLVATVNFLSPSVPSDQRIVALADRCFAAAYFRQRGLA